MSQGGSTSVHECCHGASETVVPHKTSESPNQTNSVPRYAGPSFVDPLPQALDRGPKALDLLSSPLVLDYLRVKFTGTLPPWTSQNPFQPDVNEGSLGFATVLSRSFQVLCFGRETGFGASVLSPRYFCR